MLRPFLSFSRWTHFKSALALTTALSLMLPIGVVQAQQLQEALGMAYQGNPVLQAQRAAQRAIDEGVMQANAGYLPSVSGDGSVDRTQSDFTVGGIPLPNGGIAPDQDIGFAATNRNIGARMDQPLFRGFRTRNGVKQAKAEVMAGRAALTAVEQDVLLETVTAYMNVLRDEAVLKLNDNQVAVLRRQLEASQDRFTVGEITRTDVAQSQARLADALSRRAAADADLTASREQYRRVVGELPTDLTEPALPILPMTLDESVTVAFERSPQIVSARFSEQAAKSAVSSAKGSLLPSINTFASVRRAQGVQLLGPDVTADTTSVIKSVGAELTVPFYQSGAEYSAVRQAKQLQSQRLLEIRAAERQVLEQVTTAWNAYQVSLAQIDANEESVKANEIALEGVRQEAAVGSRTTLDVLDAEQESLDSRVNLIRAQRDQMVAAYSLLASVGQLTASQQNLNVPLYNPDIYAEKVDWKLFGFGTE